MGSCGRSGTGDGPGRAKESASRGTGMDIGGMVMAVIFAVVGISALVGGSEVDWLLKDGAKFAFAGVVAVIGLGLIAGATLRDRR